MKFHGLFSLLTLITVCERIKIRIVQYLPCSKTHRLVVNFTQNVKELGFDHFLFLLYQVSKNLSWGAPWTLGTYQAKTSWCFHIRSAYYGDRVGPQFSLCACAALSLRCSISASSPLQRCRSLLLSLLVLLFKLNLYKRQSLLAMISIVLRGGIKPTFLFFTVLFFWVYFSQIHFMVDFFFYICLFVLHALRLYSQLFNPLICQLLNQRKLKYAKLQADNI